MAGELPAALEGRESYRWRDYWKSQKLAQLSTRNYGNPQQFWDNKRTVQQVYLKGNPMVKQRSLDRLGSMDIPPGSRVLDIGGGPGALAVPLASRGCRVTMVEPSAVMREAFDRHVQDTGVTGITVIPERWEDVDIAGLGEPFDIVIASFSLTMVDIGEAIGKMQQVCRGSVHLFWFLTSAPWAVVVRDLWPVIHGVPFRGETTADCLWQVLHEMGIHAHLHVEPPSPGSSFATVEDAVEEFYQRLNCTEPAQKEVIRAFLRDKLTPGDQGFLLKGSTRSAHIWWDAASAS
jgi:ubiquinone/menaquinone biosynthesis C-methylase UbiE